MFDHRFCVPLLVIFVGALVAQENSSNQEDQTVASNVPINATSVTFPPSDTPTVPSPGMTDTDISTEPLPSSTRSPRRHHSHGHDDTDMHFSSSEGTGDWDYIGELSRKSPHLAQVLQQELARHVQEDPRAWAPTSSLAPPHRSQEHTHGHKGHAAHAHARQPTRDAAREPSWAAFCQEAAVDDEEPFRVSDGSFHPRYEEVPGVGVYRLHAHARTWEEARKMCEREGTQLAVPNSREEALALTSIHNRCPRLLPTHFNDYQYLGVHDLYSEGDWETVVGDFLNETGYMVWSRNQPDNAHHHGENCLSMNRNGFFNDVPCWTELPYICEHP